MRVKMSAEEVTRHEASVLKKQEVWTMQLILWPDVGNKIIWSSERRAKGGCLGTRKAMKVVASCEKPRGAANKL